MKRISYPIAALALLALSLYGAPAALAQCTRVAPGSIPVAIPAGWARRWAGLT